ncbi:TPA: hypothetical protein U1151_001397 [Streptococcus suis]|nr:hypothetical protein [Streptococcus suis]
MKNKKYSVGRQKEPHSLPLSTDIGALRTRFHPNLLLHLYDSDEVGHGHDWESANYFKTGLAFTLPSSLDRLLKQPSFMLSIVAEKSTFV